MRAHSTSQTVQIYGFDSADLRHAARRQLGVSSFILACFGLGCALALAI